MKWSTYSIGLSLLWTVPALADARAVAYRLYNRLASVPPSEAVLSEMTTLVSSGRLDEAAHKATDDDEFYNTTIRQFAAALSNRQESPAAPLNDFIAMFIGVAAESGERADARSLLSDDFTYLADPSRISGIPAVSLTSNAHYDSLDKKGANLRQVLARREPQGTVQMAVGAQFKDAAGVLTSRAWGEAHLVAGTNRRAIEYAFQEFLCTGIKSLADGSIPDYHVRQDVTRAPGGNGETYQALCSTCHAGLDALAGAYAHFDFGTTGALQYTAAVQPKMLKNSTEYPDGFVTTDDSWTNHFIHHQNESLGWHGATSGIGIKQLGKMLAASRGFSRCFAKRAFRKVCGRDPQSFEDGIVDSVADSFEKSGYQLRRLFEAAAVQPVCIGQ